MTSFKLTDSTAKYKEQFVYMEKLGLLTLDPLGLPLSAKEGAAFALSIGQGMAHIDYSKKSELFYGAFLLAKDIKPAKGMKSRFELCGAMIDNSRNSVTTVGRMKDYIAYSAALGLNCVYLYNEDTFVIEGEPYFGYMRDPYSVEDIKELCAFAHGFGVEVIPCIQTLAHLNQALRWACYWSITDMGDTMLADEEKTYALVEKMVATWRAATDTVHINIGMDEAHYLGRGKHLDKHGWEGRFDIMCRHLARVADICEKYGFKPMMWSDMFFRIAFGGGYYNEGDLSSELLEKVPKNVTLVYWDYYSTDIEQYKKQLARHFMFPNEIAFAGGAWKWSGFTPGIDHSWRVSELALDEIKAREVKKVMATCWGDDGADCLSGCILPILALYGAENYADGKAALTMAEAATLAATGYSKEEFFELCRPSVTPCENRTPYANPTKYLFYNDVLKGMFDKHTTPAFSAFYKDCRATLATLAERESPFAYLFATQSALCRVLELKATIGVRLKAAYDCGDKATLKEIAEEALPEIRRRTEDFYAEFRQGWMKESRPGGFDTQDLRIGGMLRRVLAAEATVKAYLNGEIERIEELDVDRLYFDCREEDSTKCLTLGMNSYRKTATANIL